jgi:hypothetical protein
MKAIVSVLILVSAVHGEEPSIVFDNRPEWGAPKEAAAQEQWKAGPNDAQSLFALTGGTIKTVRVRYFNKNTWATEDQARDYVRGFLDHKSLGISSHQVWSQGVGVPEIECIVEFTEEHQRKLRELKLPCRDGRLLIWKTVSCFRDALGRWWFVNAFDHFHRAHPEGNRKLARGEKRNDAEQVGQP